MSVKLWLPLLIVILAVAGYFGIQNNDPALTVTVEGQGAVIQTDHTFHRENGESRPFTMLNAQADNGWCFSHWLGEGVDPNRNEARVIRDADREVIAVFLNIGNDCWDLSDQ